MTFEAKLDVRFKPLVDSIPDELKLELMNLSEKKKARLQKICQLLK